MQTKNICRRGNCNLTLPFLAATLLLIRWCFSKVFSISAASSSILSKRDYKSPSLDVKALIIVDFCPQYLLRSMSEPPLVDNLASLKQYA